MPKKKLPAVKKLAVPVRPVELYGVETKILSRGVRRNLERFPEYFMFQLTKDEAESLRIQFGTLKPVGRGQHRKSCVTL